MGENPAVNRKIFLSVVAFFLAVFAGNVSAQGTVFFYQGRLSDNGAAASGVYELRFALFDAAVNGNAISVPQTNTGVVVMNGLFATNINFGAVFSGTNYWLSIGVRTNASTNAFTLLSPRQSILPTPYAMFANTASNVLGSISATQLIGTLPSAQVAGNYFGSVNFTNATNSFTGKYFGNGVGLTNLNGSMIATGTVADARLSTNVALLNTNQTFSGVNVFNNATNSFTGNFFGNGLVGWQAIPSNTVQAVRDTGYLLLSSNLTTVTLPPTASLIIGDIVRISGAGSGGWRLAQNAAQVVSGVFLNASNASWLPSSSVNVVNVGWQTLASSGDGLKLVGSALGGSGIYVSTDAGRSWISSTTTYTPVSVASSGDGVRLVGVNNGAGIIVSTNSGSSWQPTSAPNALWTCVASSADGNRLVATINNANIYTSTGGSNWTARASVQPWNSVASSADGSRLAAVVFGGKIWTSSDYGTNWTEQNAPATNWISITSSADGSRLAAAVYGAGGRIYTSGDYGVSWTLQAGSPTNFWYNIASSFDGGRLFACAAPGGVYVSVNGGLNWARQSMADQNWHAVACSDDGTKAAALYASTLTSGGAYYLQITSQYNSSTAGVTGSVSGGPGTAVELQYIGNNAAGNAIFMPVSGTGTIWGN
jgi:hypothetical protein